MAFVLKVDDSYSWPVPFDLPIDGGRHERRSFDARFKRLPQSRIDELLEAGQRRVAAMRAGEPLDGMVDDASVARELVIGWSGITDEVGEEIPFSAKALEQLIEVPMVAQAIVQAWGNSLQGAKRKN
jgi:hypothetical protein